MACRVAGEVVLKLSWMVASHNPTAPYHDEADAMPLVPVEIGLCGASARGAGAVGGGRGVNGGRARSGRGVQPGTDIDWPSSSPSTVSRRPQLLTCLSAASLVLLEYTHPPLTSLRPCDRSCDERFGALSTTPTD